MGIENMSVLTVEDTDNCVLCGKPMTEEGYCSRERCNYNKDAVDTYLGNS